MLRKGNTQWSQEPGKASVKEWHWMMVSVHIERKSSLPGVSRISGVLASGQGLFSYHFLKAESPLKRQNERVDILDRKMASEETG